MVRYPHWEPIHHPVYKYRLVTAHRHNMRHFAELAGVSVKLVVNGTAWATLYSDGVLMIEKGYAWDGGSGPAVDTMNSARATLVHDVLYQMIADGRLPQSPWNRLADAELYHIARQDGMSWWRAWRWWLAVRIGGKAADKYAP